MKWKFVICMLRQQSRESGWPYSRTITTDHKSFHTLLRYIMSTWGEELEEQVQEEEILKETHTISFLSFVDFL